MGDVSPFLLACKPGSTSQGSRRKMDVVTPINDFFQKHYTHITLITVFISSHKDIDK